MPAATIRFPVQIEHGFVDIDPARFGTNGGSGTGTVIVTNVYNVTNQFNVTNNYYLIFTNVYNVTNQYTVLNQLYVTNVFNVTNWFTVTNLAPRHVIDMPGTIISPVGARFDLSKTILGPTTFWLGTFAPDEDVVIWLSNPGSHRITWPSGLRLPYGPLPTNATSAAVWFKNVNGAIWASP